jgi:hypothetical protein
MSSPLYTFCYHSLHHFPSPKNTEVLAQIVEYDLNLHMQRLQMPFSNQSLHTHTHTHTHTHMQNKPSC